MRECTLGSEPPDRIAELLRSFVPQEPRKSARRAGFWLRVPLASANTVNALAERCQFPFNARVWPVILAAVVAAIAVAMLNARYASSSPLGATADFFLALLLTFFAYSLHELGHASALKYSGARPGNIGFTLYLIFPAFYSDVTDAWRLPRWRRLLVDVSGSYFECIAIIPLAIAFLSTHCGIFWYSIVMIGFSIFNNANPVFRFDGYWALRDMFGTANVFVLPSKLAKRHADDIKRMLLAIALAVLLCGIWIAYASLMLFRVSHAIISLFQTILHQVR